MPSPPSERMLLAVLMMLGTAWIPIAVWFGRDLARRNGLTLGELISTAPGLRGQLIALVTLVVAGLVSAAVFLAIKGSTRVVVGADRLAVARRGLPLVGWWQLSLDVPWTDVDSVQVSRERRGTIDRIELRILAGRDEVRLNLEHAVTRDNDGKLGRLHRVRERSQRASHPLVQALAEHVPVEGAPPGEG